MRAPTEARRPGFALSTYALVCASWLLALAVGCAIAGDRSHARSPEYAYGFYNATGAKIRNVALRYAADGVPHNIEVGLLGSDTGAEWSSAPDPIAKTGTVSWCTLDGQDRKQEVEVSSRVKDLKGFTGIIWLKINKDGGVEVIPMTYSEQDRRAKEKQPFFPE